MTKEPKVSIVVPIYNTERYLEECLQSIMNQTLKEIEIICMDDGSTDHSPQILDQYAQTDSRIKVIHKANTGYGHTMNLGMKMASGQYIGIVESDDWVQPDMYETLYNIAANENLDFIKSDFYRFEQGKDGKLNLTYNALSKDISYYKRCINPTEELETFQFIMNTWCGIYKTSFIRSNSILHNETPGAVYQDNGFWFQTFVKAQKIMFYDTSFYMNRRDNPDSSVFSKGKIDAMKKEYDYIESWLAQNADWVKYIHIVSQKRYANYLGTLDRISFDDWKDFLVMFAEEYQKALEQSKIDESLFSDNQYKRIRGIVSNPVLYYQLCVKKLEEIRKKLNSSEKVIIYGTGAYGRKVIKILKELNLVDRIACMAVTDKSTNALDEINGIPVYNIGDISPVKQDMPVIIAVKPDSDNEKAISDNLRRIGYCNISTVKDYLPDFLDWEVENA